MTEAISISTSKYIKTIKAKIDDHVYTVRKIGAGEQLDLSNLASEAQRVHVDVLNLRGKYETTEDKDEKDKLLSEIMEAMKPLSEIEHRIEEIYCGLFDDGDDGKYSKALVKKLGIDNIQAVYAEVIGQIDGKTDKESA